MFIIKITRKKSGFKITYPNHCVTYESETLPNVNTMINQKPAKTQIFENEYVISKEYYREDGSRLASKTYDKKQDSYTIIIY